MDKAVTEQLDRLMDILDKENEIIIYGAGHIARMLYKVMKYCGCDSKIKAFAVKEKKNNPSAIHGIAVEEYMEYINVETKIIIGLVYKKQTEVYEQLLTSGLDERRIIQLDSGTLQAITDMDECLFDSADYWEQRYMDGGNSGAGSYNRLAEFKAEIINTFVKEHHINSVIEWGCGDGNQLSMANYPHYIGFDVSQKAIEICKQKFREDSAKHFIWCGYEDFENDKVGELVLSLDVIFHLIEDEVFNAYMDRLFASGSKFVCIYSSNQDLKEARHVRHRKFTDWIEKNVKSQWKLFKMINNKYPYSNNDVDNTSRSDFYIYEKID